MSFLALSLLVPTSPAATLDDSREVTLTINTLENAYDVNVTDYYADDATIEAVNSDTKETTQFADAH